MADFVVNNAGAKIYKDVDKHEMIEIPVLSNEKEQGKVYYVLSVGILGGQRQPMATVKEENGEIVAYLLPDDLYGWVENAIGMKAQGAEVFPTEVEFGNLDNRIYGEIL